MSLSGLGESYEHTKEVSYHEGRLTPLDGFWLLSFIDKEKGDEMPRNKRNSQPTNVVSSDGATPIWKQPDNAKFINVSLNDVDKQWLQAELPNKHVHIDELFTDATDHAARVSVVPDVKSGRYNATYTAYLPSSAKYGYILSVRAATPALALFALAYADGHKDGAWTPTSDSPKDLFG